MPELKYAEALREAMRAELHADDDVLVIGEEVGPLGGVFTVTQGLQEVFGENRVMDTPIAENGLIGFAIGAAVEGMRPVVEIMFSDFVLLALDQIVNLAAKLRYMANGQFRVPMVIRMPGSGGTNHGPQHSQSLESIFAHVPGLTVVQPSTVADAYWMLRESIRSDDPVIFLESKYLYFREKGMVDLTEEPRGFGARFVRDGSDITVVSSGRMVHSCLQAAEALRESGHSAEVVDLRYIWPLDTDTVAQSLRKTSKLAVVYEPVEFCGWGAEVAAWAVEHEFLVLDAPVMRMGAKRIPIPFQSRLEGEIIPTPERITALLRDLAEY